MVSHVDDELSRMFTQRLPDHCTVDLLLSQNIVEIPVVEHGVTFEMVLISLPEISLRFFLLTQNDVA